MISINRVEKTIIERKSTRDFSAKPISRHLIKNILTMGTWAPCPHGYQPWHFIVLQHKSAVKKKIIRTLDGHINDVPIGFRTILTDNNRTLRTAKIVIVVLSDCNLEKKGSRLGNKYENLFRLFETQSIGACIQNMLLSAHTHKIGNVWLGLPLLFEKEILEILNEKDMRLMALLAFGYIKTRDLNKMCGRQRMALKKKIRYS